MGDAIDVLICSPHQEYAEVADGDIQFFSWMLENEFKAVKLRVYLLYSNASSPARKREDELIHTTKR